MFEVDDTNIFTTDSYQDVNPCSQDVLFFIDFEFNDFKEKKPISIGICSLDRKHQFYAEFEYPDNYKDVNDWVRENVVAHLSKQPKQKQEIYSSLNQFLEPFKDKNIYILSDHPVDVEIFLELNPALNFRVNIMPIQIYVLAYAIKQCSSSITEASKDEFIEAFKIFKNIVEPLNNYEQYFIENNIIQHHALNDTLVMAILLEQGFSNKEFNCEFRP